MPKEIQVRVEKSNEVYNKIYCDETIAQEMKDYFTFKVPGSEYNPLVRKRKWDGTIKLFNPRYGSLYAGLNHHIEQFCKDRKYSLEFSADFDSEEFSLDEARNFIASLDIPEKYTPRPYQIKAFIRAVRDKRIFMLSPTSSGKSLLIYLLIRYYQEKTLIIVPLTSLVSQMFNDFKDYGFDSEKFIHRIYEGQSKETKKPIILTTWQSVFKLDPEWFSRFKLVIGDEAHLFTAKSLEIIMKNLVETPYRVGVTGTLDGTKIHQLVLEGLFGQTFKVTTTSKLQEDGYISKLRIKNIVLSHPKAIRESILNLNYQEEMDYIVRSDARNNFLKNLAISLPGNTLILFLYVEKHGCVLHELIKNNTDKKIHFIHGKIESEEREEIRKIVQSEDESIIIASLGCFSTGVNIKNLNNLVVASPSKGQIRVLQSIGRVLRLAENKDSATVYDISDDFSLNKRLNTTLRHFIERKKIYDKEKFDYKTYIVKLQY